MAQLLMLRMASVDEAEPMLIGPFARWNEGAIMRSRAARFQGQSAPGAKILQVYT
jgi:hypothetical protein